MRSSLCVLAFGLLVVGCGQSTEDTARGDAAQTTPVSAYATPAGAGVAQVDTAIRAGNYGVAAALLDSTLIDAESAVHAYLNGRLDEALGFTQEARAHYEASVGRDSTFVGGWYQLALLAVGENNFRVATAHFRRVTQYEPTAAAWHGLGQAYFELGDGDSASISFNRSVTLDPNYVPVRLSLAKFHASSGQYAEAERELRDVLGDVDAGGPSDAVEVRRQLANALIAQDHNDEAIVILEGLASSLPWDPQIQYDLGRSLRATGREAEANRAFARFESNTSTQAEVFRLQERIRLTPGSIRDRLELVDVFRRSGRLEEALGALAVVVYMVPDNLHILNNAAILQVEAGRPDAARRLFTSAIDADSMFLPAYLGLSRLEQSGGNVEVARSWLERALVVEPGNADVRRRLDAMHESVADQGN